VIKNPPLFRNHTCSKALSAIIRLQETEPLPVIIDFCAVQNAYIYEKEYQNLKRMGVGIDLSWYDWNQYLIQLINLGYCEIAFHKQNKIRLTSLAKKVLFEGEKLQLTVQKINIESKKSKKPKKISS
jgi:ATP-dependent DNA helicase RecQ